MSGFEIAGLVIGIAGLVPVLREGHRIVINYRARRRLRLQSSGVTPLAGEIQRSESKIHAQYLDF
jgi:hypothetical protein